MNELMISEHVKIEDIQNIYDNLNINVESLQHNEARKREILNKIDLKYAECVSNGLIDGKNEETRRAQKISYTLELQEDLKDIELCLAVIEMNIARARNRIDMYKLIVNYFHTELK